MYNRLVRQAGEWGSRYKFWSCADVDIVQPKDYRYVQLSLVFLSKQKCVLCIN